MSNKPPDEGGGAKLDALLRAWPALDAQGRPVPTEGDVAWDERADAIVAAARAATTDHNAVERVLAAPNLPAEPGEPGPSNRAFRAGESSMSDSEGSAGSKPPPSLSGAGPSSMPRPRQSLREIAERASQSGRSVMPSSPTATPVPGRASQPSVPSLASTKPAAAASTPVPAPSRRPVEAGSSDSGVVDLAIINAAADEKARAAAAKAKPAEASLFEDDAPASKPATAAAAKGAPKDKAKAAAASTAKPVQATAAPAKSGGGAGIGIIIALVGVAAAFAIWQFRKGSNAPTAAEETPKPAVTAEAPKPASTAAQAAPSATPHEAQAAEDQGLDPSALPDEQRAAAAARGGARVPGPLPKVVESAAPSAVAAAEPPKKGGAVGTLNEEMQKATGTDGKAKGGSDTEPDLAGGDTRSKTLPERPSQGAVQAAIGTVLGGAKACVSEADDATRAIVTFKSNGSVANVTVTGWASANGKSGCVVSALKGAKVGAFTDSSYSFPVSIRP